MSQYEDFEMLINQKESFKDPVVPKIPAKKSPKQQAEKTANLKDFIEMVDLMVKRTMKEHSIVLFPDDRNQKIKDQSEQIESPFITHKIISRVPKDGFKPRIREAITEKGQDETDNRTGNVFAQTFECIIQFNIFASEYEYAEEIKEKFEENLFKYTYYFKKNGVQEIIFSEELEDENYKVFRENVSVRNIRYKVIIEKLYVQFLSEFEDISTK